MNLNRTSASDDEDDLERLRLAALQSLKKPTQTQHPTMYKKNGNFNGLPKRNRAFQGRQPRNGQFNNRVRTSNLISIPTVPAEEDTGPKLVLPQDRYCASNAEETKLETSSKFNRYNDSDKSEDESESELESEVSDAESVKKLERSDSLEALMQELQNEIEGESKPTKTDKKKVKKVRKCKDDTSACEQKENVTSGELKTESEVRKPVADEPPKSEVKLAKSEVTSPKSEVKSARQERPWVPKKPFKRHFNHKPPSENLHTPFANPLLYQNPTVEPPFDHLMPFNPHFVPYAPPNMHFANDMQFRGPRYERPLSPLTLNTDFVSTTIAAPLSPRSAAFVLQNREIIERRKRSPRRSYSRSPSPRFRRSRSPLSPPYRSSGKSSPTRRTSPPRRKYSPGGAKKASPTRRRESPVEKLSPNKPSVRERLGQKVNKADSELKEGVEMTDKSAKEGISLDPVMEARKRKFETTEIKQKEGIIRLKPSSSESDDQKQEENLLVGSEPITDEDEADDLDESILDRKFDELFTDEESDDGENEGRFKVINAQKPSKPTVLPFTQLLKPPVSAPKRPKLEPSSRRNVRRVHRERKLEGINRVKAAPSPEKKIEIKIRNPAKYEEEKKVERKVAVATPPVEDEPEVVVEDDEDLILSEGGDLRAQLSRKRAERQTKVALATEGVPTRLFETALESAVFKKTTTTTTKRRGGGEKSKKDTAPKDGGKLSIHSRLGVAEPSKEAKKKRKRNKSRGNLEQVLCFASNYVFRLFSSGIIACARAFECVRVSLFLS